MDLLRGYSVSLEVPNRSSSTVAYFSQCDSVAIVDGLLRSYGETRTLVLGLLWRLNCPQEKNLKNNFFCYGQLTVRSST